MKRCFLTADVSQREKAIVTHTALIVDGEKTVSDFIRKKVFATDTEAQQEIKTLKEANIALQAEKEAVELKIIELETTHSEILKTKEADYEKLEFDLKASSRAEHTANELYKKIKQDLEDMKTKTLVSASDIHFPITKDEAAVFSVLWDAYVTEKNNPNKNLKESVMMDVITVIKDKENILPETYRQPKTKEYQALEGLKKKFAVEEK